MIHEKLTAALIHRFFAKAQQFLIYCETRAEKDIPQNTYTHEHTNTKVDNNQQAEVNQKRDSFVGVALTFKLNN